MGHLKGGAKGRAQGRKVSQATHGLVGRPGGMHYARSWKNLSQGMSSGASFSTTEYRKRHRG